MSITHKTFEQIWDQLRAKKPRSQNYLEDVRLRDVRGIQDLRVPLPYPVTVLAGPNGCGKSTILFSLACAYKVEGAKIREFTPAAMFPEFRPNEGDADEFADQPAHEITFSYIADGDKQQMCWRRGQGKWNRSFFGRKKGDQPTRDLYLRTLASLSNPSELRGVLQFARKKYQGEDIDSSNLAFAQRILNQQYDSIRQFSGNSRTMLVAQRRRQKDNERYSYSEFHMSAGERSVVRLSMDLSKMNDALVLIDEIDASLHPFVQQQLMLELQRLALRNNLQIVVTTHSPVVLDSVPPEGRIFLERSNDTVELRDAYRDIIQKALYGRSQDALLLICEDEESEAFARGVLEVLGQKLDFLQNDLQVGRDTGKDQFMSHLETFARFRSLDNIVFLLDGDGWDVKPKLESRASELGQRVRVIVMPGKDIPEQWVWETLKSNAIDYGPMVGVDEARLKEKMTRQEDYYASAADKPTNIAKNRLTSLVEEFARTVPELFRLIGRREAERNSGDVFTFMNEIEDSIRDWRSRDSH